MSVFIIFKIIFVTILLLLLLCCVAMSSSRVDSSFRSVSTFVVKIFCYEIKGKFKLRE